MRKKREWHQGARMHVMGRSVQKRALFKEESDCIIFLKIVEETMTKMPFQLHSYCFMTNHFHMLISTYDKEVWYIMKRIMCNYAKYYNRKYQYVGHLFDSRYASSIADDPVYFLEVSRYIHLNPVKAGLVRKAEDYEYSSYRSFIEEKEEKILNKEEIFQYFSGTNKKEKYKEYVEARIRNEEKELLIQKDIGEDEEWLPWIS